MTIHNVLNITQPTSELVDGSPVSFAQMNSDVAMAYADLYSSAYSAMSARENRQILTSTTTAIQIARSYDSLQEANLRRVGQLKFGEPVVYTAQEKGLVPPKSLTNTSDIYWIEFPITVVIADSNRSMSELYVEMRLPNGFLARELIPLVVGTEEEVTKAFGTPSIGVEAPLTKIDIGEIYKQTVVVKNLRPVVVASGLGLDWFSWSVRGAAARPGSHRFVAILSAPKSESNLEISVSGHLRMSQTYLEQVQGMSDICGMNEQPIRISF